MTETVGAGLGERTAVRTGYRSLLQPRAGDADRQAGVAGARPEGRFSTERPVSTARRPWLRWPRCMSRACPPASRP